MGHTLYPQEVTDGIRCFLGLSVWNVFGLSCWCSFKLQNQVIWPVCTPDLR